MRKRLPQGLVALTLLALAGLAGCAGPAPFQPREGHSSGYTDERLGQNRYRVTYAGNSATRRETVENFLLLRAAQVSLQSGFPYFVFDTRDTQAHTSYHTDFMGPPGFPHSRFGGYWHDWDYDADTTPITRYEAYAEIVMLTSEQAKREPRAIDAEEIVRRLTPPPEPPPH